MKKLFMMIEPSAHCSRRAMLRGLGAAAAVALVPSGAGCMSGTNLPTATTSSCGSNSVCVDMSSTANTALGKPGGAMLVDALGDTIMVIRVSSTEVVALSATCTHRGCSMDFDSTQSLITCPCHGSEFSETGAVVRGPATIPLKVYTATVSNETITISG
jgi:cytochrome b6-f complex iron-sulfur subunit